MVRRSVKTLVKKLLARRGLAIRPLNEAPPKRSLGYIAARETVSAARCDGLSVCEYVEKLWNQHGKTQKVIDRMSSVGILNGENLNIIEIGAGTGRYLEKILQKTSPAKYESYETAKDWAEWLRSTYPIIAHEADGVSLKQTPSHSIDLLHAHGVFVYLPFVVSWQYFKEIWRVMKPNGSVVFDVFSENVMDVNTVEKWLRTNEGYPCFLSKGYVTSKFESHGFRLIESFPLPYGSGESEYLVFKRITHDQQTAPPDR